VAYDTDGFHDLSLNTTRLTVPPGLGIRKVRLTATVRVSSIAAGSDNFLAISKNGLFTWLGNPGTTHENSAATASQISIASGPVAVADGDYFECYFQTSGGVNIANVQNEVGPARTLGLADINAHLVFSSGSPVTVTVPVNASVAFPIGSTVDIAQAGAGQVSITGEAGVTLNKFAGRTAATAGQHAVVRLRKVAPDTWTLFGDLA
jgi:hypothetical protein